MFKPFIAIFFTVAALSSFAADTFEIKPYFILGEKGIASLHFQTARNIKLVIDVKSNSSQRPLQFSNTYAKGVLNKLSLGEVRCQTQIQYKFTDEKGRTTLERGNTAIPCMKSEKFFMGFISDTQIKSEAAQKRSDKLSLMVEKLKKNHPFSVLINAGDIVQNGGRETEWINFFKTADKYQSASYLVSAIGNHEYYESEHIDLATPEFMRFMRDSHSNPLGNIAVDTEAFTVIALNTNFKFMTEAKIQEQWKWLEAKLVKYQSLSKPVFITFHHSPYSSSVEWVREIPERLRNEFVPMIEKYSCVKAVLTGHLHMYERSYKNGIHYIVAGPSGGILNPISYVNPYMVTVKPFLTTFTLFEFQNETAIVKTYDFDGTIVDQFKFYLKVN